MRDFITGVFVDNKHIILGHAKVSWPYIVRLIEHIENEILYW